MNNESKSIEDNLINNEITNENIDENNISTNSWYKHNDNITLDINNEINNEELLIHEEIINILISMGFDTNLIRNCLKYNKDIENIEEAITLLTKDNNVWQHNYINNDLNKNCLVCGEDSDHINYKTDNFIKRKYSENLKLNNLFKERLDRFGINLEKQELDDILKLRLTFNQKSKNNLYDLNDLNDVDNLSEDYKQINQNNQNNQNIQVDHLIDIPINNFKVKFSYKKHLSGNDNRNSFRNNSIYSDELSNYENYEDEICHTEGNIEEIDIYNHHTNKINIFSTKQKNLHNPNKTCEICLIEDDKFYHLNCNHSYCINCWKDFIENKVNTGDIISLTCMKFKCPQIIPENTIKDFCTERTYEKYLKFKTNNDIINSKDKKFCPVPNCNSFVVLNEDDLKNNLKNNPKMKYVICGNNHQFCYVCTRDWHGEVKCVKVTTFKLLNNNLF